VHYGLTSTDVVDTALSYLLLQANKILEKDLENFIAILGRQGARAQDTVMMGRTHGVHAEPTTFGLKLALWHEEMKRNLERFRAAKEASNTAKFPVRSARTPTSIRSSSNTSAKLGTNRRRSRRRRCSATVTRSTWRRWR
jgi:adenylosuccinate lyase